MLANWITLSRLPLLAINVLVLFLAPPEVRLAGVVLLFVGLMLDTVDGVVARKTQQTSLFGSVLDIAADRTYELVLWVCFAYLRLIPVAIPDVAQRHVEQQHDPDECRKRKQQNLLLRRFAGL